MPLQLDSNSCQIQPVLNFGWWHPYTPQICREYYSDSFRTFLCYFLALLYCDKSDNLRYFCIKKTSVFNLSTESAHMYFIQTLPWVIGDCVGLLNGAGANPDGGDETPGGAIAGDDILVGCCCGGAIWLFVWLMLANGSAWLDGVLCCCWKNENVDGCVDDWSAGSVCPRKLSASPSSVNRHRNLY